MKSKVAAAVLCVITSAYADDQQKALDAIASFAERVCQTAPIKSTSESVDLSGKAKADLKGLLSKVADLGIEGAAQYKKTASEGVLQKDLAGLISKNADCKFKISEKLIDKLVNNAIPKKSSYKIKLRGNAPVVGTLSGISMTIQIDDNKVYNFSNINNSALTFSIDDLLEGSHTFNFTNINGYYMNPMSGPVQVPQISGASCEGQFTVAKSRTYQIIAWVDNTGLTCDLR